jgi:hypothetical protein
VIGAMCHKVSGAKFVNLSAEEGDMCNVSSSFKGKSGDSSGQVGCWYTLKRLLDLRHFQIPYLCGNRY